MSVRSTDVAIVGGGIIGCSIALRLAQQGVRVCVIERGRPGAEASSAAAGMIAPQGEAIAAGDFFRLCTASRDLYADFASEIEELSGEHVGYRRDGTVVLALDPEADQELDKLQRAHLRLQLPMERLDPATLRERIPQLASGIRGGLLVPGDHWVNNERLTQALAKACERCGVRIQPETEVRALRTVGSRVECLELSAGERVAAGQVVLAAGCWSSRLAAPLGLCVPVEPCRGQMLEFESDTELPCVVRAGHHYLVPREEGRVIAGSTMEHVGFDKAVTGEGLWSILTAIGRIVPLAGLRFRRAWAGLRPDTADHLPILGYGEHENLVFATGHFRNGILLAPITARLIADLILTGRTSHGIAPYSVLRFRNARQGAKRTATVT
jgi:glycine oxidase